MNLSVQSCALSVMMLVSFVNPSFAQEATDQPNYIRINISSFESYSDMVRKLITGQIDRPPEDISESLPAINISDLSEKEIKVLQELIEEHSLPSDTISVAGQLDNFSKTDERVKYLDTATHYAHYALPYLKGKPRPEFKSDLNTDNLKKTTIPDKPIYRISVNGEFEYYDGKPITGSKSVKKKYNEGYKPVSEVTFFYQAKKNGIIIEGLTAKEFLALSREEQKLLLHNAIMMINEQSPVDSQDKK